MTGCHCEFVQPFVFDWCDLWHVFPAIVQTPPPSPRLPAAPKIFNFTLCVALSLLTPQAAAVSRIAGKRSVHDAAKSGDVALLQDHLTADPNCVDARDDEYDRTALLHVCCIYVTDFWMHFISEIYPSLPVLFISRSTPFILSASEGHVEACKLLISARADVNARHGLSLILSAYNGHVEVCKLLISARADVNATDDELYLPLPCTFFQNMSLIFECILILKFNSHFRFYLSENAPP